MQLWSTWIEMLGYLLSVLTSATGLSTGLAIIALTLLLRLALSPLSWACAWSACVHQKRMQLLRPELDSLRTRCGDDPSEFSRAALKLHRDRGVPMINSKPLLGALAQMPVLLGMFQMLRGGIHSARFLWIENIARPDFWLAILAGATTMLVMAANPDIPEQARLLMLWLPGIIAFVFALQFASGLALYWATSNCFAAVQTWAVHRIVGHRIRSGKLRI